MFAFVAEFSYLKNTLSITRKHQHGDVTYCIAMLCNYKRPLVPKPLPSESSAQAEQPQDEQPQSQTQAEADEGVSDQIEVEAEPLSETDADR